MPASPGSIAFYLGPLPIRWYGILMATSIVVGLWVAYRQAKREGLPADDIISAGQWAVLAGLAGARIYEVIFNWDYYGEFPWKIPAVWEGGLAMHGSLIAGPLVGIWLAYRWRLPVLRSLDVAAPSIVLGQAIGRWGNYFNEEAFGRPTDLPWKLFISKAHRPPGYVDFEYFHPTFLYESLWNLAVFAHADRLAAPAAARPAGRALLRVHRPLFHRAIRHRGAAARQLLDRRPPRGPGWPACVGIAVALIGLAWVHRRRARPLATS